MRNSNLLASYGSSWRRVQVAESKDLLFAHCLSEILRECFPFTKVLCVCTDVEFDVCAEYAFAYHPRNRCLVKSSEPHTPWAPCTPVIDACKYQGEGGGGCTATTAHSALRCIFVVFFQRKKIWTNKSKRLFHFAPFSLQGWSRRDISELRNMACPYAFLYPNTVSVMLAMLRMISSLNSSDAEDQSNTSITVRLTLITVRFTLTFSLTS